MQYSVIIFALVVAFSPVLNGEEPVKNTELVTKTQIFPTFGFRNAFTTKTSSNLILTLSNPLQPIYQRISARKFPNRGARLEAISKCLRESTAVWQAPILSALRPFNVNVKSFWISNQISVKNANPMIVSLLRGMSFVRRIAEEIVFPIIPINPAPGRPPNGTEWGVKKIGAEGVWNQTKGAGVIVAVIDTGVRGSHNALKDNFAGENAWYDPIRKSPTPNDENGHGTHCTGLICGNNGIGVAPEAKWMACRGCDNTGCPQSALLACGQWLLCPTDAFGRNPDCSKAPHIVSNSWSGSGGQTWYNDVIKAWNAAGIISIFAIGNEGPDCGSAGSPGDQPDIISVGSTDIKDTISPFSSRGPKKLSDGLVLPLIVAPGADINSAYHLNDNAYQVLSGTSMATPHVAGAAALLLSKNPKLTMEEITELLISTTEKKLGATGTNCGNKSEKVYPNYIAGHGRINISKAFNRLTSE